MGMITGIETIRQTVSVYVDGVLFLKLKKSFYDEMPLCEGNDLDEEDYLNRLCAKQSKKAYDAALDLLSDHDLTSLGLKTALKRKGYLDPVIEAVCERLTDSGLINDARFAERYVELHGNGQIGRYALKRKLRAKGITQNDAEDAMESIDDAQQLQGALETVERLKRRYDEQDPFAVRNKLSQALARRGYSWDIISQALSKAGCDVDSWE